MTYLWLEILGIFFLVPFLIYIDLVPTRFSIPLLTLAAAAAALLAAHRGATFHLLGLTSLATFQCIAAGLGTWLISQLAIMAYYHKRGWRQFPFVFSQPRLFCMIAVAYAVSVAAQEFLYRSYFFWRYDGFLPLIPLFILNVIAFGWVHIVFRSWVSVLVTAVGGVLFTGLYVQFHSSIGVCIVHMAFGLSIFAMGWGRYFYFGSAEVTQRVQARVSLFRKTARCEPTAASTTAP
jgi:hypothetical protein